MKQSYFHKWLHDAREIALHELRNIFRDGGVLLTIGFDVRGSKQLAARREMHNRIKQLFERYGIDVPDSPVPVLPDDPQEEA